ncbi:DUF1446 domain-containing protein [Pseudonocardiaceae bacterium YIM PH 21723]|nr:DUF1446 domain-containing protein [Pseudonocardiaceae bacterium YIM PH 21723]
MSSTPIRIANFSGYLGDRYTAIDEVLAGDPVDVIIGDYLAEITLAGLVAEHRHNHDGGYVRSFVEQLRPNLAEIARRGMKVVTNAGGFNPAGLAAALRREIGDAGLKLRVAHVEGDNVLADLPALLAAGHRFEHLDTGRPLSSWDVEPMTANAYLGGWGIAAALSGGADIVVCGRVSDASLVLGPAAWWHGWAPTDWDAVAGGVVAGHIIECGPQAVGGNFSGFTEIPGMLVPGFPIAEVAADGTSVITKHTADGGAVTVDTVTAQLVYEIQGPRYLNSDVTVHLDDVRLAQLGPDRVAVSGVIGSPPPPTTKVAVFGQIGYSSVNTVYVTGLQVSEKIDLLRAQVTRDLPVGVEVEFTRIGEVGADPDTQWDATVALRVMAVAKDMEALREFDSAARLRCLYLQSIPGFFTDGASILQSTLNPRIDYWPALLPVTAVPHRVVFADGRQLDIAPATQFEAPSQPVHDEPRTTHRAADVRQVPLGTVAYARSGDKGGNSNLGIWTPDPRAWEWLRDYLSTDQLRLLMPEAKDLEIIRHEFPNLRAVHFVLRGLLGTGGSANLRVDQVGKAVGEFVRTKYVPVPEELLTQEAN